MEHLSAFLVNCSKKSINTSSSDFTYNITPLYKLFQNEGNLAWEYNPLRNYRVNSNLYETNYSISLLQKLPCLQR